MSLEQFTDLVNSCFEYRRSLVPRVPQIAIIKIGKNINPNSLHAQLLDIQLITRPLGEIVQTSRHPLHMRNNNIQRLIEKNRHSHKSISRIHDFPISAE